jgi:hypothetical protein
VLSGRQEMTFQVLCNELDFHKFTARHLKVKVNLEQAMKGQRGSRDIAILFI